jgi:hypothetical protein
MSRSSNTSTTDETVRRGTVAFRRVRMGQKDASRSDRS